MKAWPAKPTASTASTSLDRPERSGTDAPQRQVIVHTRSSRRSGPRPPRHSTRRFRPVVALRRPLFRARAKATSSVAADAWGSEGRFRQARATDSRHETFGNSWSAASGADFPNETFGNPDSGTSADAFVSESFGNVGPTGLDAVFLTVSFAIVRPGTSADAFVNESFGNVRPGASADDYPNRPASRPRRHCSPIRFGEAEREIAPRVGVATPGGVSVTPAPAVRAWHPS